MFINRESELELLERLYRTDHAELFVLYGRRRVGKTELLQTFCTNKPHLFFVATMASDTEQLAGFSQAIWGYTHSDVPVGFTFPSWEAAFSALSDLPGRPIVVLDEFTYLVSGNKAIPSILQKVWDKVLRNTNVLLILCGSYIGMMERDVMGYEAALYGRRTGSALLEPLRLRAAAAFFPRYSTIQQIEAWAILGGMPYYLRAFSDDVEVLDNAREHVLGTRGLLYNEPSLLVMEELREPRNYFSILRSIAQGHTRLNEITQSAGVGSSSAVTSYLEVLQQMHLVERHVPVTERQPGKSKKGVYHIADPFLRFWFRYVHPNRGSLEIGLVDAVLQQRIRPTFEQFVGYAFEDAAREHVAYLAQQGALPFLPERIGSWWDRQAEIDVVAVSDTEGSLLVGECKWSNSPVGVNILDDLKRKAQALNVAGQWQRVWYALWSKSGFTPTLRELSKAEHILLVDADRVISGRPKQPVLGAGTSDRAHRKS